MPTSTYELSHLRALEAEAIHIIREVAAEFERPGLLFSGGKDSIVMLHLAVKAFTPARVPFPVMHVDTGHNFAARAALTRSRSRRTDFPTSIVMVIVPRVRSPSVDATAATAAARFFGGRSSTRGHDGSSSSSPTSRSPATPSVSA